MFEAYLLVHLGVPVAVKHDDCISSLQIKAQPACSGGQGKDEVVRVLLVEVYQHLRPAAAATFQAKRCYCSIQPSMCCQCQQLEDLSAIAIICTSDQPYWLAETCKLLPLLQLISSKAIPS